MAEGTTTVQALELQIKSNAMGASSSLTALATSLGKIKEKIAGGLNLGNVATEIGKFVTNLKSIGTNDDIDRITKLTNSITGLVNAMKNLSGVKSGTAALKQAVDSTSAVKEYVGKHVGSEYVGRHENANYVGRHETDGLREAAQEAAKVAEMAATTAKSETVSAEEANKMTSALAESAAKAKETQAAVLATAESLKAAKTAAVEISTATRVPAMATREQMLANRAALAAERGCSVSGMFGRPNIDRSGYVKASEALADKLSDAAARALGLKGTMEGVAVAAERGARASVALAGMATATSHTETAGAGLKGAADSASAAKASIADTGKEAEKSASKLETLRSAVDSLKHSFKDLTKHGVLGFLNSMVRVAKYRMYRALIRNITEGFSTGLKNLREYSKAVDNLYNKDMTGLDNSLLKMKNSLGAALGSAIQSLIPLFQQLSQWVITASNYINQFIALLSGRNTWTRAVDVVASDFEKTEKSAAGAAKETKNLLAAWDELNIIQSQGGNGGGGSGNADNVDYTKMFEEVDEFDGKLKEVVGWIRENFDWIRETVFAIGSQLLLWKLSAGFVSALAGVNLILGKIAGTTLGLVMGGLTVYLDWKFMTRFTEDGKWEDLATASIVEGLGTLMTGILVARGFKSTAAGLAAAGAVLSVSGLVDLYIGFRDILNDGVTREGVISMIKGALGLGVGVGMMAKNFKSLAPLLKSSGLSAMQLGMLTFGVAASVTLSASLVTDALQKGSLAELALSSVTDALSAASLGVMAYRATDKESTGMAVTAITLELQGATNIIASLKDIKARGFNSTNIGALTKGGLESAIGSGLFAKALGATTKMSIVAGLLTLALTGIAAIITANAKTVEVRPAEDGITLNDDEIRQAIGTYIPIDVTASLNVVKAEIENTQTARSKVAASITGLTGRYKVLIATGVRQLTPEEKQGLADEVAGIVEDINGLLSSEQRLVEISLGMYSTDESGNSVLKDISEGITVRQDVLRQIGNQIGKALSEGTVEEYRKMVPDLIDILNSIAGIQQRSAIKSQFNTAMSLARDEFEKGELSQESMSAYIESGEKAIDEAKQAIAAQTQAEYQSALENVEFYRAYLEDPEKYKSLGIDYEITEEMLRQAEESLAFFGKNGENVASIVALRIQELLGDPYGELKESIDAAILAVVAKYGTYSVSGSSKSEQAQAGLMALVEMAKNGALDDASGEKAMEAFSEVSEQKVREYYASLLGIEVDKLIEWEKEGLITPVVDLNRTAGRIELGLPYDESSYAEGIMELLGVQELYEYTDGGFSGSRAGRRRRKPVYGTGKIDTEKLNELGYTLESIYGLIDKGDVEQAIGVLKEVVPTIDWEYILSDYYKRNGITTTGTVSNTGTYATSEVVEAIEETMEEGNAVIKVGVVGPAAGDTPVAPPGAPTYDESADDDSATETAQAEQTTVLRGMLTVLQQLLNKEVTARFVPSAAAGAAVQQAIRMAERMSG